MPSISKHSNSKHLITSSRITSHRIPSSRILSHSIPSPRISTPRNPSLRIPCPWNSKHLNSKLPNSQHLNSKHSNSKPLNSKQSNEIKQIAFHFYQRRGKYGNMFPQRVRLNAALKAGEIFECNIEEQSVSLLKIVKWKVSFCSV